MSKIIIEIDLNTGKRIFDFTHCLDANVKQLIAAIDDISNSITNAAATEAVNRYYKESPANYKTEWERRLCLKAAKERIEKIADAMIVSDIVLMKEASNG